MEFSTILSHFSINKMTFSILIGKVITFFKGHIIPLLEAWCTNSCTSVVPQSGLQFSNIPREVPGCERAKVRLRNPTGTQLGLGRDFRKAPGRVWPVMPVPIAWTQATS